MIKSVKCVTKGCEVKDQVVATASLFINGITPLDGPFICPKCGKPMKVVARIPANKGKSGKPISRTTISKPTANKVGKRKRKPGLKIKVGKKLGVRYKKSPTKSAKKPGPRKRGLSKS
jgi:hypothetical protein